MRLDFTGIERNDWRYLTVYDRDSNKPVATIVRKGVYEKWLTQFRAYNLKGTQITAANTREYLMKRIEKHLSRELSK